MTDQKVATIKSPFQMTFKDVLNLTGLTSTQFWILCLFLATALGFLYMLYRMGVILHRHKFTRETQASRHVVFSFYQGEYMHIGGTFDSIRQHTKGYFKKSQLFGIYYDDPQSVVDKATCRAVVGILVESAQAHRINPFLEAFEGKYSAATIPQCEVVETQFPFFNNISFILLPTLVYPKLMNYLRANKLEKSATGGVMEFYDLMNAKIVVKVAVSDKHKGAFWLLPEGQEPAPYRSDPSKKQN